MLHKRVGRKHVYDLRRARITDWSAIADDKKTIRVNGERGIVDARVVIFWPVENDGAAFKSAFIAGLFEIALAERFGDYRSFHDRAVEKVAFEIGEASLLLERPIVGPDDVRILDLSAVNIFTEGAAGNCQGVLVKFPLRPQFCHDRRKTSCTIILLPKIRSRRHHVHEQGNI